MKNIVADNEALVIDIDLSNNQNLILATIYCPNRNLNLRLFQAINNNLSDNVMFVGDLNSKKQLWSSTKLGGGPEVKYTQDIDKYADFMVAAVRTAVDKVIPT